MFEKLEIFWLICVGVVLANAAVFRHRLERYAAGDSRLLDDGRKIVKAFALYGSGLFILLAIGTASGLAGRLVPFEKDAPVTPFDFFCLLIVLAIFGRATIWVFRQEGAERLAEHRKMFNSFPKTPDGVKVLWLVLLAAVVLGWLVALFGNRAA